jgi:hypothetical protein
MQGVFPATFAELLEFQAIRIVATILLGSVIPLLALGASQVNHHADIFFSHRQLPSSQGQAHARPCTVPLSIQLSR